MTTKASWRPTGRHLGQQTLFALRCRVIHTPTGLLTDELGSARRANFRDDSWLLPQIPKHFTIRQGIFYTGCPNYFSVGAYGKRWSSPESNPSGSWLIHRPVAGSQCRARLYSMFGSTGRSLPVSSKLKSLGSL